MNRWLFHVLLQAGSTENCSSSCHRRKQKRCDVTSLPLAFPVPLPLRQLGSWWLQGYPRLLQPFTRGFGAALAHTRPAHPLGAVGAGQDAPLWPPTCWCHPATKHERRHRRKPGPDPWASLPRQPAHFSVPPTPPLTPHTLCPAFTRFSSSGLTDPRLHLSPTHPLETSMATLAEKLSLSPRPPLLPNLSHSHSRLPIFSFHYS